MTSQLSIYDESQALSELMPARNDADRYTLKKRLAVFGHDCIAHPLTWLFRDAAWAWRFHDFCGDIAMNGSSASSLRISGTGAARAVEILVANGMEPVSFSPTPDAIKSPQQSTMAGLSSLYWGQGRTAGKPPRSVYTTFPMPGPQVDFTDGKPTTIGLKSVDLVVGDVVASQGGWRTISAISRKGHKFDVDFEDGTGIWCRSVKRFRVRETGE